MGLQFFVLGKGEESVMSNIKSSLFGGYSKKDVDNKFEEMKKENDSLKSDLKIMQIKLNEANAGLLSAKNGENGSLEQENKALKERIAKLEESLKKSESELKSQKEKPAHHNDGLSGIDSLYLQAYKSAGLVTREAAEKSEEYLSRLEEAAKQAQQRAQRRYL